MSDRLNIKSYDYRLIIEIIELNYKIDRLAQMLLKFDDLEFTPECSYAQLDDQLIAMYEYRDSLLAREDVGRVFRTVPALEALIHANISD